MADKVLRGAGERRGARGEGKEAARREAEAEAPPSSRGGVRRAEGGPDCADPPHRGHGTARHERDVTAPNHPGGSAVRAEPGRPLGAQGSSERERTKCV